MNPSSEPVPSSPLVPAGIRPPARHGVSRRLRRAALASVTALAGAEVLLRVLTGLGHPLLLQKDPDIGYLYQPGQDLRRFGHRVRINSFHQRGAEVAPRPAAGVRRILFVGDSVTFGTTQLDQDEILTAVVARQWPAAAGSSVDVLNASAGSWGLGNQLAYLERFGIFGADMVVFQIGSHDLLQRKSTSERVGVDPVMPDRLPLTALGELWSRYLQPRLTGSGASAPERPAGAGAAAQFATNMTMLTRAIALVREAGAQPVILHTPNRDEVAPPAGAPDTQHAAWRREFLERAAASQVPVIDLSSRWAHDPAAGRYFLDGVHLSASGCRSAAQAVLEQAAGGRLLASPAASPARRMAGVPRLNP